MSDDVTRKRVERQIRLCIRAAILLLVVLYGLTYGQLIGAYSMGGLLLLTLFPISIEVDRIGQVMVGVVCLAGAYSLAVVVGPAPPHPISQVFSLLQAFTCVWALMFASLRLMIREPIFGHKATILTVMFGVFVSGGSRVNINYHAFVLVFVALALFVAYLDDPTRPRFLAATGRRKTLLAVALVTTGLVMSGLWVSLPMAYQWATKKLGLMITRPHQTGFDMFFKVGSLQNVIKSRRVVLRVRGSYRGGIYLRGVVYNRYRGRCWVLPKYVPKRIRFVDKLMTPASSDAKGRVASPYTTEFVAGDPGRYFVPLRSGRWATTSGRLKHNPTGILTPVIKGDPELVGFTPGIKRPLPVAPPSRAALFLPKHIEKPLRKLALAWTKGVPHNDTIARMNALRKRLEEGYKYSLSFQRPKKGDPVLDFLYKNKQGHCEYFASALALLARSIGISTRVAGGYLASEYSGMGKYYIVRDQNAHAWVEAWIPNRGWRTYDATPASDMASHMPKQSAFLSGLIDMIRVWSDRFRQWLGSLTYVQLFVSIGSIILFWIGIRVVRRLRERSHAADVVVSTFRDPLPAFESLMRVLASILPKKDAETLERYAERLRDDRLPARARAAAPLILSYASFRYGDVGEEADIEQQIQLWLGQED